MSFQQGLSGLNAAARNLDVIGNNVANNGTVGAKVARAEFSDAFANSLGGSGSNQIGIGVTVSSVAQQFTQGDIATTNNPLDVAIDGAGFFQLSTNGSLSYTRNGQFKVDADGYIVSTQGGRVQGNVVDPTTGVMGQINTDVRLSMGNLQPKPTSELSVGMNLDARTTPTPAATAFDPTDAGSYTNMASMKVYAPQGQTHTLATYYRKTADNSWDVYASLDGTPFATNPLTTLTFGTDGRPSPVPATLNLTVPFPANEGGNQVVETDLTAITQFGSPYVVTALDQDGYSVGELSGFRIAPDGDLLARYSNGRSEIQARLVLTNFRNPQGLQPVGGNQWVETAVSGPPNQPQAPGTGSLGMLQSGALEQSNVELTGELVNMITAQRVYQANAQTIRAQDQLLQTIVNLR
jgi:flagellar hook protein FlgE